jgi:hypothetical protein
MARIPVEPPGIKPTTQILASSHRERETIVPRPGNVVEITSTSSGDPRNDRHCRLLEPSGRWTADPAGEPGHVKRLQLARAAPRRRRVTSSHRSSPAPDDAPITVISLYQSDPPEARVFSGDERNL